MWETSECACDELRTDEYASSDVTDARGTQRSAAGDGDDDDASRSDDTSTRTPPRMQATAAPSWPLPASSGIEKAVTPCDEASRGAVEDSEW